MRAFATALLAACAVAGCGSTVASLHSHPPSRQEVCQPDFSDGIYVDVELRESDNGRAVAVPLCGVIQLVLSTGYGQTHVADQTVLETLQRPSAPGFRLWLLAKRTGTTTVSATSPSTTWEVSLTVMSQPSCPSRLGSDVSGGRHLTVEGSGRTVTLSRCEVLSVQLRGSASAPWSDLKAADPDVLETIPFALPDPGEGSIDLWFLAKNAGSTSLTASSPSAHWSVRVTVVP